MSFERKSLTLTPHAYKPYKTITYFFRISLYSKLHFVLQRMIYLKLHVSYGKYHVQT